MAESERSDGPEIEGHATSLGAFPLVRPRHPAAESRRTSAPEHAPRHQSAEITFGEEALPSVNRSQFKHRQLTRNPANKQTSSQANQGATVMESSTWPCCLAEVKSPTIKHLLSSARAHDNQIIGTRSVARKYRIHFTPFPVNRTINLTDSFSPSKMVTQKSCSTLTIPLS